MKATKQNTAKLVSYKAYGTRATHCCESVVQEQAQNYARNTGFTRWSILID